MFMLKYILRNMFRHKLRSILTVVGVAVAVLAFGLLRTLVGLWYSGAEHASATRLVTRNSISLIFPLPVSYLGFAAGAAFSWGLEANDELDWARALDLHLFRNPAAGFGRLFCELGDVYLQMPSAQHVNGTMICRALYEAEDPLLKERIDEIKPEELEAALARIEEILAELAAFEKTGQGHTGHEFYGSYGSHGSYDSQESHAAHIAHTTHTTHPFDFVAAIDASTPAGEALIRRELANTAALMRHALHLWKWRLPEPPPTISEICAMIDDPRGEWAAKLAEVDDDAESLELTKRWAAGSMTCDLPLEQRRWLASELAPLIEEHQNLWVSRNRPGGLKDSVRRLTNILKAYTAL